MRDSLPDVVGFPPAVAFRAQPAAFFSRSGRRPVSLPRRATAPPPTGSLISLRRRPSLSRPAGSPQAGPLPAPDRQCSFARAASLSRSMIAGDRGHGGGAAAGRPPSQIACHHGPSKERPSPDGRGRSRAFSRAEAGNLRPPGAMPMQRTHTPPSMEGDLLWDTRHRVANGGRRAYPRKCRSLSTKTRAFKAFACAAER